MNAWVQSLLPISIKAKHRGTSQAWPGSVHPPNPNLPIPIIYNPKVRRHIPLLPPQNIEDARKYMIHHSISKMVSRPFKVPLRDPEETARQPFVADVGIVSARDHDIGRAVVSGDVPAQSELGLDQSARESGGVDPVGRADVHFQTRRGAFDSVVDVFVGEIVWG